MSKMPFKSFQLKIFSRDSEKLQIVFIVRSNTTSGLLETMETF